MLAEERNWAGLRWYIRLADGVGLVALRLQLVSQGDLVKGETVVLESCDDTMLQSEPRRIPPAHESAARRRANRLRVVVLDRDRLGNELGNVGPHLVREVCGARGEVVKSEVVDELCGREGVRVREGVAYVTTLQVSLELAAQSTACKYSSQ